MEIWADLAEEGADAASSAPDVAWSFPAPERHECGIRADTIVPRFPEGRCSAAENSDGGRNERFRRQGGGAARGACQQGEVSSWPMREGC